MRDEIETTKTTNPRKIAVLRTGKRPIDPDGGGSGSRRQKEPRLEEDDDVSSEGEGDIGEDGQIQPFQDFSPRTQRMLRSVGRPPNLSRLDDANILDFGFDVEASDHTSEPRPAQPSEISEVQERRSLTAISDPVPGHQMDHIPATTTGDNPCSPRQEQGATEDAYRQLSESFGINNAPPQRSTSADKIEDRPDEGSSSSIPSHIRNLTGADCLDGIVRLLARYTDIKIREEHSQNANSGEVSALKSRIHELEVKAQSQERELRILEASADERIAALETKIEKMSRENQQMVQKMEKHDHVMQAFKTLTAALHAGQHIPTPDAD
ncbi:uncharacterized protein BDV17DRAFT_250578 [Aspergillus undulatus]|uniref:uncharacterized protein n=1 Tax=Aspergillus undulatus TaxID=1810928 RepID=UPI003CCE19BE